MLRTERLLFLTGLIGRPWRANAKGPDAYDCWHLACYVEYMLFDRYSPTVEVPDNPTWPWMVEQFKSHPELKNWKELKQPLNGLLNAADGSIVLMARNKQPAHCGVYLEEERAVIHCDQRDGVCLQDILTLKGSSWSKLRFYEPSQDR